MPLPLVEAGLPILLGLAGWYLAVWRRIPAAPILGPMLFVGTACCLGVLSVDYPLWFRTGLQMVIGTYTGYRVNRAAVRQMASMGKAIALTTVWMVGASLLIGYLLARLTDIDMATAFLGTTPGGISEVSALAMGLAANVALVATLQTFRLVSTLVAMPALVRRLTAAGAATEMQEPAAMHGPAGREIGIDGRQRSPRRPLPGLICLATGIAGGLAFLALRVPAAGIMGAMLAVAGLRVSGLDVRQPPIKLRTLAQIGIGVLIGGSFTAQTLAQLGSEFLPIMAATAATLASSLTLGRTIQRWTGVDLQTALLSVAPAGITQMAVVAEELGANTFVVSVFQLTRLISAVVILPILIRMLI